MSMVTWYLELALRQRPTSWSFEQVAVQHVLDACKEFRAKHPTHFAYIVVRCNEYGIPQLRKRVVGGSPWLVHKLAKKRKRCDERLSAVEHWTTPRGTHMRYPKWHRRSTGAAERHVMTGDEIMVMPVTGPGYTVNCTHSNYWSDAQGESLAIMTAREHAQVQTFPDTTVLPERKGLAMKGVGNSVPPRLAMLLLEDYAPPPEALRPLSPSLRLFGKEQ